MLRNFAVACERSASRGRFVCVVLLSAAPVSTAEVARRDPIAERPSGAHIIVGGVSFVSFIGLTPISPHSAVSAFKFASKRVCIAEWRSLHFSS